MDNSLTPTITNDHQRSSDLSIFENDIQGMNDARDVAEDDCGSAVLSCRELRAGKVTERRISYVFLLGAEQVDGEEEDPYSSGGC